MNARACSCGVEVVSIDGRLYQRHDAQRHYAALNAGNGRRKAKPKEPEPELTEAQVRARLRKRDAEMKREGKVT